MVLRDFDAGEDLTAQRELFAQCFPEHEGGVLSGLSHYRWKFESPLLAAAAEQFVAEDQDQLLGYYGAIPIKYTCGNDSFGAALVCDVMTSPLARGRGVFTALGRHATQHLAERKFDFTTGFPIRKEVIPGHLKVGWKSMFVLPLHVRIIDAGAVISAKGWRRLGLLASGVQRAAGLAGDALAASIRRSDGYSVRTFSTASAEWTDELSPLAANFSTDVPIALEKSERFLKWRLGSPGADYSVHLLRYGSQTIGYAITRLVPKFGVQALAVLDVYVLKQHRKRSAFLLRSLAEHARQQHAAVIAMMASAYQARQYGFAWAGILPTPLRYSFIVKDLCRLPLGAEDSTRWQLMWIDTDMF